MFAGPSRYGWMNSFVCVLVELTLALDSVAVPRLLPGVLYDTWFAPVVLTMTKVPEYPAGVIPDTTICAPGTNGLTFGESGFVNVIVAVLPEDVAAVAVNDVRFVIKFPGELTVTPDTLEGLLIALARVYDTWVVPLTPDTTNVPVNPAGTIVPATTIWLPTTNGLTDGLAVLTNVMVAVVVPEEVTFVTDWGGTMTPGEPK